MNQEPENYRLPEVREKAEKLVKDRFRYSELRHPLLETLFDLGVERAARDLAGNPDTHDPEVEKNESPSARSRDGSPIPLGPLELLVSEIKLPALPQVLIELLRVINDPASSATDLAEVISMDTSLASYLLRIVNSAYYSFPFPIDTVTRAVVLIGNREISSLAFSTSFLKMFKASPAAMLNIELFWKHNIACGIIARALAQHCKKKNPARHFVAGLLHDIGRLVIFSNLPDLAKEIMAVGHEKTLLLTEAEQVVLGFDHARFGGALLGKWNFPSTLVAAVLYHHAPDREERYGEPGIVHIADIITKALGLGSSGQFYVPPVNIQTWEGLRISPEELVPLIRGLDRELEATFDILLGIEKIGSR
jgi:HD-like signal output (HDOD) protein